LRKIILTTPILVLFFSGCATSNGDILAKFKHTPSDLLKIEQDIKTCEVKAYNAGHTRRGGLLTEGPRVDYIESCLEKKQWKKR
jgi:hypothetical protein